jgi:hypothetical protein
MAISDPDSGILPSPLGNTAHSPCQRLLSPLEGVAQDKGSAIRQRRAYCVSPAAGSRRQTQRIDRPRSYVRCKSSQPDVEDRKILRRVSSRAAENRGQHCLCWNRLTEFRAFGHEPVRQADRRCNISAGRDRRTCARAKARSRSTRGQLRQYAAAGIAGSGPGQLQLSHNVEMAAQGRPR